MFILGAGFSTAAGLPTSSKILERLMDSKLSGLISKVNMKVDTFEELLSKIDLELYYLKKNRSDYERLELLKNLRRVLLTKLTSLMQNELTPEMFKSYTSFLKQINLKEDAILSFNYDLVFEKVLASEGINYQYFYQPSEKQERVPIIKLHGSINHFHCDRCDEILMLDLEEMERGISIDNCPKCNNQMDRALIPPTLLKKYVGTAVEEVWPKALQLLQEAEKLIFVGYRIPDADLLSYQLFLFSLLSRKEAYKNIEIVLGPQKDNYSIFRKLYGKRGVDLVETGLYFEEWLHSTSRERCSSRKN